MTTNSSSLPKGWRWAALKDFATNERHSFVDGPFGSDLKVSDLTTQGIPLVRIQHVGVAEFRPGFDQFVSEKKFAELSKHDVLPGDLVFAKLGDPAGRSTLIPSFVSRGLIVADCVRLRIDPSKVEPKFLGWAVNAPVVLRQIGGVSKGSTRQRANLTDFKKVRIPVPDSRNEQQRIARELESADRFRRQHRYLLELSEAFVQSLFLRLFGDPVRNTKGWNVELLEDICDPKGGIKAGPFGSSLKKEFYSRAGIRIYGQEQVIAGDFSVGDYYISPDLFEEFRAYEINPGDLLLSLVGTFGKVVIVPENIERGIINPRLLKISPLRDRLDSVFLAHFIQHPIVQTSLKRMSHGGTMGILNAGLLKQVRVIAPPLPMQQQFTKLVARHERQRAVQRESLRQSEHLFQTLLHRAFGPCQ